MVYWIIYLTCIAVFAAILYLDSDEHSKFLACFHKWPQRIVRVLFIVIIGLIPLIPLYPDSFWQFNWGIAAFFQWGGIAIIGFVFGWAIVLLIKLLRWVWK